jgi:DNA-binding transcriptional regulator/RsmH inhibitor MraZ
MIETRLDVPAELRELAEKAVDQAEQAFGLFFDSARKSTSATVAAPVAEFSRLVLAFWEESLKTSFDYARKVALASSLRQSANLQTELVKRQIATADRHLREMAQLGGTKDQP